jgi:hypothetical protein
MPRDRLSFTHFPDCAGNLTFDILGLFVPKGIANLVENREVSLSLVVDPRQAVQAGGGYYRGDGDANYRISLLNNRRIAGESSGEDIEPSTARSGVSGDGTKARESMKSVTAARRRRNSSG